MNIPCKVYGTKWVVQSGNLEILVEPNQVGRLKSKTEEVRKREPKPSVGKY